MDHLRQDLHGARADGLSVADVPRCAAYSGPARTHVKAQELSENGQTTIRYQVIRDKTGENEQSPSQHPPEVVESIPVEIYHQAQEAKEEVERNLEQLTKRLNSIHRDLVEEQDRNRDLAKEAQEYKRLWKKVAGELNNLRSIGQGFYQVTDLYLIELITQVRHNIRGFSIQYFDGYVLKGDLTSKSDYAVYADQATPYALDYLKTSETRIKLIQAFVWNVLMDKVFGQFHWLGDPACKRMRGLRKAMAPDELTNGPPHMQRKFHVWQATTVGMLLAAIDTKVAEDSLKEKGNEIVSEISRTIKPCAKKDKKGFEDQLHWILSSAWLLDKEIHMQVAQITWENRKVSEPFDSASMELDLDDCNPRKGSNVRLSLAPGVLKRGKSTGEDFDVEQQLMKGIIAL